MANMIFKLSISITHLTITFFLFAARAYAVDTNECYTPGAFTEFEAYYNYSWNRDGSAHGIDVLVGGGLTETLSLYAEGAFSRDIPDAGGQFTSTGGFGTGLLWTPFEREGFMAIDILPVLTFEPNDVSDDGRSAKPDFEGISYGCAVEINFMMMEKFQPYLIFGYTGYSNDSETAPDEFESSPDEYPVAAGFMIPAAEGIEVLGRFEWVTNEDTKKWPETGRCAAIGVNILLNDNMELITELSWSLKIEDRSGRALCPPSRGVRIGMICAL